MTDEAAAGRSTRRAPPPPPPPGPTPGGPHRARHRPPGTRAPAGTGRTRLRPSAGDRPHRRGTVPPRPYGPRPATGATAGRSRQLWSVTAGAATDSNRPPRSAARPARHRLAMGATTVRGAPPGYGPPPGQPGRPPVGRAEARGTRRLARGTDFRGGQPVRLVHHGRGLARNRLLLLQLLHGERAARL